MAKMQTIMAMVFLPKLVVPATVATILTAIRNLRSFTLESCMTIHLLYYGFSLIWEIDGTTAPKHSYFSVRNRVSLSYSLVLVITGNC